MKNSTTAPSSVVKATYFANWADLWGFPLAYKMLPHVAKVKFLTPNVVTIIAFLLYTIGSLSLFLNYPHHLIVAAIGPILGFLGDDLDGQLARYRNLSSEIGDYLDKTLDILKIFILSSSLGYASVLETHNTGFLFLGFVAAFFFMFRYYIKLETIFHEIDKDEKYLEKSTRVRDQIAEEITARYINLNKTLTGRLYALWLKNRYFFLVDEGEFAFITAIAALSDRLALGLWFIAGTQLLVATWRWFERGYQITTHSPRLLWPMRK